VTTKASNGEDVESYSRVETIATRAAAHAEMAANRADDCLEQVRELVIAVNRQERAIDDIAHRCELNGKALGELAEILGRWPRHPDDRGTGIAGRVARASSPDLTGSSVPPAVRSVWQHGGKQTATVSAIIGASVAITELLRALGVLR
jgi:hypothetical protein